MKQVHLLSSCYTACIILLLSFSWQAHAEIDTELSINSFDDNLAISSTTQIKSWYLKSFNQYDSAKADESQPDVETWFFNGGYEHQLAKEFSLFVEAGINHQNYNDLATRRGYNLSTGLNYQPTKSLSLQSKVTQIYQPQNLDLEHGFELSSTYQLIQHIDLKAAYQVELQQQILQQQVQLGLGYRF